MKNLLPLVNSEVGFSIAEYIGDKEDRQFALEELKKLKKENPVVAEFIIKWANRSSHILESAFCGILVYKMLRSQAEADKMNEEIKI